MQLPKPKMLSSAKRQMVTTFYGLDRTDLCGEDTSDGESYFSDMKNGGSDSFPFAASRDGRGTAKLLDNPANGLLGTDKLAYVDGQKLIYDGREVLTDLIDGEKRLVAFGASILVYPDQKYYNTVTGESGAMETVETVSGSADVKIKWTADGADAFSYAPFEFGGDASVKTEPDGSGHYVTRIKIPIKYKLHSFGFSAADDAIESIDIAFISWATTPGAYYAHDNIKIYDAREDFSSRDVILRLVNGKLEYLYEGAFERTTGGSYGLVSCDEWRRFPVSCINLGTTAAGYLWNGDNPVKLIDGKLYLAELGDLSSALLSATIFEKRGDNYLRCTYNWTKSNLPRLDHVCALDNRLWGCRYGAQAGSTAAVNEIYCSALGDFKKWDTFKGISTDPWHAGVAEAGPFTGAVAYGGHLIFFKEDCAYVISGSYPPYSVTTLHIAGVAQGAARSICEVDGALFYKSRYAVMRYTSSSIGSVSDRLGRLPDAVRTCAGSYNGKYYLSLAGEIYVYDTKRGMWCAEDACGAVDFATADGKLYIAGGCEDADGKYPIFAAAPGTAAEADMPWSFTTPRIGYGLPNRKYVSRVLIRLEIGDAALPTVELSRDGGAWEALSCAARVGTDGARTGSITIPIRPRRCESFRIRISGIGAYKLTGITKYMEESGR